MLASLLNAYYFTAYCFTGFFKYVDALLKEGWRRESAEPDRAKPQEKRWGGSSIMTLRKAIFWFHLIVGVSTGLVILVMSVTGVMLAYEKETLA